MPGFTPYMKTIWVPVICQMLYGLVISSMLLFRQSRCYCLNRSENVISERLNDLSKAV